MDWVIAIDPSSARTNLSDAAIGWCVFRDGELVSHGELTPDPDTGFTRVRNWLRGKFKVIHTQDSAPKITVASETAFLGPNAAIFLGLIRVKAHLESVTLDAGHSWREISPQQSFRAATGLTQYPKNDKGTRKGTRKASIQSSLQEKYHWGDVSEHEADSAAIGLAVIQGK